MGNPFSFDGSGEQGIEGSPSVSGGEPSNGGTTGDAYGASDWGASGDGERDAAGTAFDPDQHSGGKNRDGTWRRKRGRKAGASASAGSPKKTRTAPNLSASIDALSSTLMIVHAGIASVTKVPEISIDKDESDALAKSVANVLDQFDITPDPKVQAIVGLVVTAGTIYGPRMYLYRERLKQEAKDKDKSKGAIVINAPFPVSGGVDNMGFNVTQ